jgi:hypothetical protein
MIFPMRPWLKIEMILSGATMVSEGITIEDDIKINIGFDCSNSQHLAERFIGLDDDDSPD